VAAGGGAGEDGVGDAVSSSSSAAEEDEEAAAGLYHTPPLKVRGPIVAPSHPDRFAAPDPYITARPSW
jgi:hypothetical protein